MPNVKLKSGLPAGPANGLKLIADELVADPQKYHAVIALIDCAETTVKTDTGEIVPAARIRRIVPVADQDLRAARRIMARAYEERDGQTVIPLELEEDLDEAFGSPDAAQ